MKIESDHQTFSFIAANTSLDTARQYAYARALGERSVFTPQLIVNGTKSLVGSQESAVQRAVAAAEHIKPPALQAPDDGITVFIQAPGNGRILGTATYPMR